MIKNTLAINFLYVFVMAGYLLFLPTQALSQNQNPGDELKSFFEEVKKEKINQQQVEVQNSIQTGEKVTISQEIEDIYEAGITAYNEKDYLQAKRRLALVEVMSPNYKTTRKYLRRLDKQIAKQKEALVKEKKKQGQRSLPLKQKESPVSSKAEEQDVNFDSENVLEKPLKEESGEMIKKSLDEKQSKANKDRLLIEQLNEEYREVRALYRAGEFVLAEERLTGLEENLLAVESKDKRLKKIQNNIKKIHERIENLEEKTTESSKEKKDFLRQTTEESVRRREDAISDLEKWVENKQALRAELSFGRYNKKKEEKANKLYEKAENFYRTEKYSKAKDLFLQVQQIIPNFRKTDYYLDHINFMVGKRDTGKREKLIAESLDLFSKE